MSAHPAGPDGKQHSAKAAKGMAVASAALVTLAVGIVIGNVARKKVDKWMHGTG